MAADTMPLVRTLGKTDIKITPIGLGMMEFSGGGGLMGFAFPIISQEEKNATVRAALDGGINWFDTAELYGKGVSEASLATALKAAGRRDDDVVVATKWWPLLRTARNIPQRSMTACASWMATASVCTWSTSRSASPRLKPRWTPWPTWWKPARSARWG